MMSSMPPIWTTFLQGISIACTKRASQCQQLDMPSVELNVSCPSYGFSSLRPASISETGRGVTDLSEQCPSVGNCFKQWQLYAGTKEAETQHCCCMWLQLFPPNLRAVGPSILPPAS